MQMSAVQIIELGNMAAVSSSRPKRAAIRLQQEVMAKATTSRKAGIIKGFRSGLEERISRQITEVGLQCIYEADKIEYHWPKRQSTCCSDFKLPKDGGFFYVKPKDASLSQTDRSTFSSNNSVQTSRYVCSAMQTPSSTKAQRRATHNGGKAWLFVFPQTYPGWLASRKGADKNEPE